MKLFFEFLPLVLFFAAYKSQGIFVATSVLMAASALQLVYLLLKKQKPTQMQFYSTVGIFFFGALTLYFRDEQFVKVKVTVVNWLFALVFFASHFIGKETIIEKLFNTLKLPATVGRRLNMAYVIFFLFLGILNLLVIQYFSTDFWVNFKVWGLMGLTLLFLIVQIFLLRNHIKDSSSPAAD